MAQGSAQDTHRDAAGYGALGDTGAPVPLDAATVRRIVSLDFIRGLALLGILFPNITAFAHPFVAYFWPPLVGGANGVNKAVWLFQFVFIDGKFRGLFTLLFGAGMALFMERAWARGADRRLQLHRLLWLGAFGLAHYFLLWRGDILTLYAFWGLIALLLMRQRARVLLGLGLALYLGASLWGFAQGATEYRSTTDPAIGTRPLAERTAADIAAARHPGPEARALERRVRSDAVHEAQMVEQAGYAERLTDQFQLRASLLVDVLAGGFAETFSLILIGMGLYRFGLFSGQVPEVQLRFWGWTGVILGTLVTVPFGVWTYARDFPLPLTLFVFNEAVQVPHLPVILGLAALLTLWAPRAAASGLGQRLVAVGRMPLSNYLGTSVVMVALFRGWDPGLFGALDRLGLAAFVVAGWLAMLAWSPAWLAIFRFGPLEWVWRCLTYGRLFPMRRSALAIATNSH